MAQLYDNSSKVFGEMCGSLEGLQTSGYKLSVLGSWGAGLSNGEKGLEVVYQTIAAVWGSASVFAFDKISRALWHLLVHKLGIITSESSMMCFEVEPLTERTTKVLNGFFDVLGWKHAVTGKKATDFAGRIRNLNEEFRNAGKTANAIASSLAGLLNFAGGFVLGHALKAASHLISKWLSPTKPHPRLKSDVCNLVESLTKTVELREVNITDNPWPLLVYTDGAFEDGHANWGALVFDPSKRIRWVTSAFDGI